MTLFANPMAFTSLVLALLVVCVCTVWHYGSREVVAYLPLPVGTSKFYVYRHVDDEVFIAWTRTGMGS